MTYVISGRNINDLYPQALRFVDRDGVVEESRAGQVKVVPFPVVTVTSQPKERVLFDGKRDANPFFHLFECLWMVYGDSYAPWLDRFVGDFSDRFAEKDGHIFGAYGRRWRDWFDLDQLRLAASRLRTDPKDRRVVISMWDPKSDFQQLAEIPYRDVPCNTHMYPRVVDGKLDLSVCVRSNDVIWGAYGANAVHMTFVQEYLAGLIGIPVGKFYQFSNNWHAYTDVLERFKLDDVSVYSNPYLNNLVKPSPIMTHPQSWDDELLMFMADPVNFKSSNNMWFFLTAQKAWMSHLAYKEKDWSSALEYASLVEASDWSMAMTDWILRRKRNWDKKHA